ncbi:hypothetical protein M9Y10_045244 [Tritrichomonas musculus]|uniref:HMG box domain-containing protein n=1 Tax=Tritrichomonas musculus TaxID=1915356 RepID=A0ABR2JWK3_9EUKA
MCYRANTQQNLNPVESSIWQLYSQQRSIEIQHLSPGTHENEIQMTAWFEFLQMKWSLDGATDDNSLSRFDDALRFYSFGPDLRSSNRQLLNLSKSYKIKKVKNHTIKSHLKGARDGHKPGKAHNSSYTYYVHKRTNELKEKGIAICVKSTIPEIAREWTNMSDEERMAIDKEWRQYCNDLKNSNEDNIINMSDNDNENENSNDIKSEPGN